MARERLGRPLSDVAAALRIRPGYLEALEEGRTGDLPGNTYAVGYLRAYAGALGLDPDELIRRFKSETRQPGQKTEFAFPAPVPERGVPAGAVVLLGVVLAAGAYVGWYRLSGQGKLPAEVVPPVPERLAPLAEQAVPPPPIVHLPQRPLPSVRFGARACSGAGACSDAHSRSPAHDAEHPRAAAEPSFGPAQFGGRGHSGPGVRGGPGQRAADSRTPGSCCAPGTTPGCRCGSAAGQVLLNRVLRTGETWPVPAKPSLLLSTGNAGGTELVVDGVVAPSHRQFRRGSARLAAGRRCYKGRQAAGAAPGRGPERDSAQPAAAVAARPRIPHCKAGARRAPPCPS